MPAYESKEMNGLISPSIFDPTLADDTSRGLANIRAIWGIWLDNDGGDLSADEFARLFPRLRMAIFNSYSSTPEKPRWRVFIPTTVAMPIAAYTAIIGQIMLTVNKAGYWSQKQLDGDARIKSRKHHGFDMGKLTPSSLFYLPCQAANPQTASSSTITTRTVCRSIRTNGRDMQPTMRDLTPLPTPPGHSRKPSSRQSRPRPARSCGLCVNFCIRAGRKSYPTARPSTGCHRPVA